MSEVMDVEIRLQPTLVLPWRPTTVVGSAVVEIRSEQVSSEIASVGFAWGPVSEVAYEAAICGWFDVDGTEWLLEFQSPRVGRKFGGDDIDTRLVGSVMKHFSARRSCVATIVTEPESWQSRKPDDRAMRRRVEQHRWARLGFGRIVTVSHQNYVTRVAQEIVDFEPPAPFDTWGPYTREVLDLSDS